MQMDKFMDLNKNMKRGKIDVLEDRFRVALTNVTTIFGDNAFQRWQPERNSWRKQVLASLYDAEMLALQHYETTKLAAKKLEIIQRFQELFLDSNFLRSVDAATNTPSFLKFRVRRVRELVSGIL